MAAVKSPNSEKKSFILYHDYIDAIQMLTNDEKGVLFQQILEYVNYGTLYEGDNRIVGTVWLLIKNNLDRDATKWEEKKTKDRTNGRAGGIISALKRGQAITPENINFLKENFSIKQLKEWGVTQEEFKTLGINTD